MTEITAQDLRALRHADRVTFHRYRDGGGEIVARVDASRSSTGFEQGHGIAVDSTVECFDRSSASGWLCYAWWPNSRVDPIALTLIHWLRAGDDVSLRWRGGNDSPLMKDAGLHLDELMLVVKRGKTSRVWRAAVSVSLDNTARMVRPA